MEGKKKLAWTRPGNRNALTPCANNAPLPLFENRRAGRKQGGRKKTKQRALRKGVAQFGRNVLYAARVMCLCPALA